MKINKDNCMLIDIQYVKPKKEYNYQDCLYIIWKDLDTGEKYVDIRKNPTMNIYFTKEEHRNHDYNKVYEYLDNVDEVSTPYKDILKRIAKEIGPTGERFLDNAYKTDFSKAKQLHGYPYVYSSDIDVRAWYRIKWLETLDNDRIKKLSKGFLDIEADTINHNGFPDPETCPVNAVTVVDGEHMKSYTFLLVDGRTDEEQVKKAMNETDTIIEECHDLFDNDFGDFVYKFHFYEDERQLLKDVFRLINTLKLDVIGIWNMGFDIPYLMDRMTALGMDIMDIIPHPDFPIKECYYKKDTRNFAIKNKTDHFACTSYTIFVDMMILYAVTRKGQQELRSNSLSAISKRELKNDKFVYEEGNIKTLPYVNFKQFMIYNIKDTLLLFAIEKKTRDIDKLYKSSYKNATPYSDVFKVTVLLRYVQYMSFLQQGLIPSNNINALHLSDEEIYKLESEYDIDDVEDEVEEDDDDKKKKVGFEGALVADPTLNEAVGLPLFGRPTNYIFRNTIDMDMGSFYPNSIIAMNIDASTLIGKLIVNSAQFINGKMTYRSNHWKLEDEVSKDIMDDYQTGNILSFAYKWLGLPSVSEVYRKVRKKSE